MQLRKTKALCESVLKNGFGILGWAVIGAVVDQHVDKASPRLLFAAGSGVAAAAFSHALGGGPVLQCLFSLASFWVWRHGVVTCLIAVAAGTLAALTGHSLGVAAHMPGGSIGPAVHGAAAFSLAAVWFAHDVHETWRRALARAGYDENLIDLTSLRCECVVAEQGLGTHDVELNGSVAVDSWKEYARWT